MTKLKLLIFITTIMLMTACSNIPFTTMYKLMMIEPLDIDPRQLVIIVRAPNGIKVRDGDIVIDFSYQAEEYFKHKFLVKVTPDYQIPSELIKETRPNEHLTVLQLSKKDATIMYQAQQIFKKRKKEGKKTGGGIGIHVVSVCRDNSFSWENTQLDIHLKFKDDEEFFTFMENIDVTELDDDVKGTFNNIAFCDEVD